MRLTAPMGAAGFTMDSGQDVKTEISVLKNTPGRATWE
jgi:hypothetical protein